MLLQTGETVVAAITALWLPTKNLVLIYWLHTPSNVEWVCIVRYVQIVKHLLVNYTECVYTIKTISQLAMMYKTRAKVEEMWWKLSGCGQERSEMNLTKLYRNFEVNNFGN